MSMDQITRQSVLDLLNGGWAEYVAQFQRLSPAAQSALLEKQGYKRLADLLAHIMAWWEVGLQNIQEYQRDPSARQPEIDVNSFNARAVEQARGVDEAEEIRAFDATRLKFVECVQALSDADFKDERVLNQLRWELVNHLEDHKIQ
jgi:hypothetical protein